MLHKQDQDLDTHINLFKVDIFSAEDEEIIINRINCLDLDYEEFIKLSGNYYQYALDFDLQREKGNLREFIDSDLMQENFRLWRGHKNTVAIEIRYDDKGFPEYFKVAFKDLFRTMYKEIDLIGFVQMSANIKSHQLTYIDNYREIMSNITSIADQLESMDHEEIIFLLSKFNEQWFGQLTMTYMINNEDCIESLKVEDTTGRVLLEHSSSFPKRTSVTKQVSNAGMLFLDNTQSINNNESKLMNQFRDKNQSPKIANTRMSFWKRNIPSPTVATLTVGIVNQRQI